MRFKKTLKTLPASNILFVISIFQVLVGRFQGISLKYKILYPEKGFLANLKTQKKPIKIGVLEHFRRVAEEVLRDPIFCVM